jgi:hypothetical protein
MEVIMAVPMKRQFVSLEAFNYDKERKVLSLVVYQRPRCGFPKYLMVQSHHTGKEVRFSAVDRHDKLFDEDHWDGMQQIYRPIGNVPNVDHLVLIAG